MWRSLSVLRIKTDCWVFVYSWHDVTVWSVQTVYSVWAPCIIAWLHSSSTSSAVPQSNVQQAIISHRTKRFGSTEHYYSVLLRYDTVKSAMSLPIRRNNTQPSSSVLSKDKQVIKLWQFTAHEIKNNSPIKKQTNKETWNLFLPTDVSGKSMPIDCVTQESHSKFPITKQSNKFSYHSGDYKNTHFITSGH